MNQNVIPLSFYRNRDVVTIAKQLLGKVLCVKINDKFCSGIICETEAYNGVVDRASHAYGGRRTKRTGTMYKAGGVAYVYLCYGVHSLFNIVTSIENEPHAVLIRGIIPFEGKENMLINANKTFLDNKSGIGPGKVTKLLNINTTHDGLNLTEMPKDNDDVTSYIWLEDRNIFVANENIKISSRIGVDYAGDDANLPYRFELANMKF